MKRITYFIFGQFWRSKSLQSRKKRPNHIKRGSIQSWLSFSQEGECFVVIWGQVSLCSPGWSGAHHVYQASLELPVCPHTQPQSHNHPTLSLQKPKKCTKLHQKQGEMSLQSLDACSCLVSVNSFPCFWKMPLAWRTAKQKLLHPWPKTPLSHFATCSQVYFIKVPAVMIHTSFSLPKCIFQFLNKFDNVIG